ncbi:MAG: 4-(cytidine 5'-diphospho)-2-C-methyl-D-erythritol kinase [Actinomycetales bacterium]|nr:4-(cytidine 5'-diphospho)-2-C-methyl-D-erythritol kinase [Actinomycetales bacterium]
MVTASASASVSASAPGKLNVFLGVGRLRADGYHDVCSVYLALDLRDRVTVRSAEEWSVSVTGSLSAEHLDRVPRDETNIVVAAARLVARLAGIAHPHPVAFEIEKNIPVAGGMGGGSADAAAALVAVNELWATGLSREQLQAAAVELGADVPFALLGGCAIGEGVGDQLVPISVEREHVFVMLPNDKPISTPAAYRRYDELVAAAGDDPKTLRTPVPNEEMLAELNNAGDAPLDALIWNDLEEPAIDQLPELGDDLELPGAFEVSEPTAYASFVSGSGPTLAFACVSRHGAELLVRQLAEAGRSAVIAVGPAEGARLEVAR